MKTPKAFWVGIVIAFTGCTQLLELDQDYQSTSSSSSSSGEAGAGGAGGGGSGGTGGSGGAPECVVDADCGPAPSICTVRHCQANVCFTDNTPQGTACEGMNVCDGNGICGQCNTVSDCTMLPPDDECQTKACDNHVCTQTFTPAGTKLAMQTMGDCQDAQCDGAGQTVMQANDMDLPEDNNPCTKNVCTNGSPSHPNEPANTTCGINLICDNAGQCVGCVLPTDCAGNDDFCKTRTCTNGMCGFSFTAMGTDLPTGQTTGDCKVLECDNQGNIVTSSENTDLPVDGKPCTKDVCTAGIPSNPIEATGTPCGGGSLCNAAGLCQKPDGGTCAATADCQSNYCVEGYCCNSACAQNCKACNIPGLLGICSVVPAGYSDDTCPSPQSCDGSGGASACTMKFPMGYLCSVSTQCGSGMCVDGVCCSSACTGTCQSCNVAGFAGTCTNIPLGQKDAANCTGQNSCNGAGVCKKDNGATCSLGTECLNNICVDGYCCNSSCGTTCQACNVTGALGTCTNVPAGSDDAPMCIGSNSCNGSGACKKDNGQGCVTGTDCVTGFCADGVCCNTSCAGTCQACNVAGNVGTCSFVPTNADDVPSCMGTNSCDGAGSCKKDNGQTCAAPGECLSGTCIDGVCCGTACLGTCQACNVAGALGTCVNVPMGQEDLVATTTCTGLYSCNGAGACLLDPGQPCNINTECASNNCLNMICQ